MRDDYAPKIAIGHNQKPQLRYIFQIGLNFCPPLFEKYRYLADGDILWFSYETEERRGNLRYGAIGRPKAIWKFPVLTIAEWNFWTLNVCGGNRPDGFVTIYTFNRDLNTWGTYNALCHPLREEIEIKNGLLYNIQIEFLNLEPI